MGVFSRNLSTRFREGAKRPLLFAGGVLVASAVERISDEELAALGGSIGKGGLPPELTVGPAFVETVDEVSLVLLDFGDHSIETASPGFPMPVSLVAFDPTGAVIALVSPCLFLRRAGRAGSYYARIGPPNGLPVMRFTGNWR